MNNLEIEQGFDVEFRELFGLPMVRTVLSHDNHTVTFSPTADVTIGCKMDLSSFPFDQQHCQVRMQRPGSVALRNLGVFLRDSLADFKGYRMKVTCMNKILVNFECKYSTDIFLYPTSFANLDIATKIYSQNKPKLSEQSLPHQWCFTYIIIIVVVVTHHHDCSLGPSESIASL